ncbi:MAG: hypothetical protein D6800_12020, partial [Candidatus Zixiibacteriota bacterium]
VSGYQLVPGEKLDILVDAVDASGVTTVVLRTDGQIVSSQAHEPFSFSFSLPLGATPGTDVVLDALAFDAQGQRGQSLPVTISIVEDVDPPYVALVNEPPFEVIEGTDQAILVVANDSSPIQRFELYDASEGTVLLADTKIQNSGDVFQSVYGMFRVSSENAREWSNKQLRVRAYDYFGNVGSTNIFSIRYINDYPPEIGDLELVAGTIPVFEFEKVQYRFAVSEDIGLQDVSVDVLSDTLPYWQPLATGMQLPYSVDVRPVDIGAQRYFRLRVSATDSSGQVTSVIREIPVRLDDVAPAIAIQEPTDNFYDSGRPLFVRGTVYESGQLDSLRAEVRTGGTTVWANDLVWTEPDHAFAFEIPDTALAAGTVTLTVLAVDVRGNSRTFSRTLHGRGDAPPRATILAPPEGEAYLQGEPIELFVFASDDHAITQAVAYAEGAGQTALPLDAAVLLGEQGVWVHAPTERHEGKGRIRVVAYDDRPGASQVTSVSRELAIVADQEAPVFVGVDPAETTRDQPLYVDWIPDAVYQYGPPKAVINAIIEDNAWPRKLVVSYRGTVLSEVIHPEATETRTIRRHGGRLTPDTEYTFSRYRALFSYEFAADELFALTGVYDSPVSVQLTGVDGAGNRTRTIDVWVKLQSVNAAPKVAIQPQGNPEVPEGLKVRATVQAMDASPGEITGMRAWFPGIGWIEQFGQNAGAQIAQIVDTEGRAGSTLEVTGIAWDDRGASAGRTESFSVVPADPPDLLLSLFKTVRANAPPLSNVPVPYQTSWSSSIGIDRLVVAQGVSQPFWDVATDGAMTVTVASEFSGPVSRYSFGTASTAASFDVVAASGQVGVHLPAGFALTQLIGNNDGAEWELVFPSLAEPVTITAHYRIAEEDIVGGFVPGDYLARIGADRAVSCQLAKAANSQTCSFPGLPKRRSGVIGVSGYFSVRITVATARLTEAGPPIEIFMRYGAAGLQPEPMVVVGHGSAYLAFGTQSGQPIPENVSVGWRDHGSRNWPYWYPGNVSSPVTVSALIRDVSGQITQRNETWRVRKDVEPPETGISVLDGNADGSIYSGAWLRLRLTGRDQGLFYYVSPGGTAYVSAIRRARLYINGELVFETQSLPPSGRDFTWKLPDGLENGETLSLRWIVEDVNGFVGVEERSVPIHDPPPPTIVPVRVRTPYVDENSPLRLRSTGVAIYAQQPVIVAFEASDPVAVRQFDLYVDGRYQRTVSNHTDARRKVQQFVLDPYPSVRQQPSIVEVVVTGQSGKTASSRLLLRPEKIDEPPVVLLTSPRNGQEFLYGRHHITLEWLFVDDWLKRSSWSGCGMYAPWSDLDALRRAVEQGKQGVSGGSMPGGRCLPDIALDYRLEINGVRIPLRSMRNVIEGGVDDRGEEAVVRTIEPNPKLVDPDLIRAWREVPEHYPVFVSSVERTTAPVPAAAFDAQDGQLNIVLHAWDAVAQQALTAIALGLVADRAPPVVDWQSPVFGAEEVERTAALLDVRAHDNVRVAEAAIYGGYAISSVTFIARKVNGSAADAIPFTPNDIDAPPFRFRLPLPDFDVAVAAAGLPADTDRIPYYLCVRAKDDAGNESDCAYTVLNVVRDQPPEVVLLTPRPGSVLIAGAPVVLRMDALDDLAIESVVARFGSLPEVVDRRPPYEFVFTVPERPDDTVALQFVATDSYGHAASSQIFEYPIQADRPPAVVAVAPVSG